MLVPITSQEAVAHVTRMHEKLVRRRTKVASLEAYFEGRHPLAFASREWSAEHGERYKGFSDNWCGVVGSAPAERTEVYGFRLGSDSEVMSDDERTLWSDWQVNGGPAQASQGFLHTVIAKRSAVHVWGDENDEPVMSWEHPGQFVIDYTPDTRRRRRALKSWVDEDEGVEYATLMTPDEVWKFQRKAGLQVGDDGRTRSGLIVTGGAPVLGASAWRPRSTQDTGDDQWPLRNPLGVVPMVEFLNRPMLGGRAVSDIEAAAGMQDAVNLLWAYAFVNADFTSMPARVVMGQEPPKVPVLNEMGQKVGEVPVDTEQLKRGRMLWLTGEKSRIGQWDPASLSVFTDVINIAIRHISAQSRTPIYLVHGELGNVNGETLAGLDAPLVGKVRESHKFHTPSMREVFGLMAKVRGNEAVAQACRTGRVQWKNPEVRSDAQISDAALKDVQIGWPLAAVLEKRYGMEQPEIDRVMGMIERETAFPTVTADAAAAAVR